jgi:hypothetical protein
MKPSLKLVTKQISAWKRIIHNECELALEISDPSVSLRFESIESVIHIRDWKPELNRFMIEFEELDPHI